MDHSYFTRWFVLVELCGLCASQDSQLRLMPSPGQAYGATARISVEFPLVSFVNNFYIASERVYQVSYASPDFLLPAASESSYKTRISESAAIGPSSVSVFLNISNLAQTEVGKTMFVRDTTNAVVSQVAFNITECPNITTNGIVTRYSLSPCGVGCVGNFTCTSGYIKASITANCREDATWSANPITMGLCKSVPVCINSNVPTNESYLQPSPGNTSYPDVLNLTCAENHIGSALAQCSLTGTWDVANNCNGTCEKSMIPSDVSLNNTLSGVLQVGQSVVVPCNTSYVGVAIAMCTGPGQWNPTSCLAVCVIPQMGNASETYCSNTTSSVTIFEGNSTNVQCCVNPITTVSTNCSHVGALTVTLDCAERSSGLDGGIIALIVILCLLAVGCIVVVVVLYKRKKACFADKADKNPPTEGPACTPLNENQPKNPDSSNDNLSSDRV
uniref:E-selectin-like n=1 Tax=Phallusia mammillata TaxID=59560 RepID=A0A6F9DSH3_9ASCI|nr:E-selectin-like [Phallusia mammillata]